MARTRTNFRTRAAMAALAGLTAFSLAGTPAFAGDWHGRGHGYGYGNGRGYGQHGAGAASAGIAASGGMITAVIAAVTMTMAPNLP